MRDSFWTIGRIFCLGGLLATAHPIFAQGTAFTYQGRLNDNALPANGRYDLVFSIWNASSGPPQVSTFITNSFTAVSNGLFAATLDFGSNIFTGPDRWLEIGVRTNGVSAFTTLSPRQSLTATPYAVYAGAVKAAGIDGSIPAANIAGGTITSNMLAPGTAAANLAANGQSPVPGGAMILSTDPNATNLKTAGYTRVGGQLDLSWQQRRNDAPRSGHTAVWTGNKMIVWGGTVGGETYLNTGGYFDPAANIWLPMTITNAPIRRSAHVAVWTGTKMIVWGGSYFAGGGTAYYQNTGGQYDPAANSWIPTTTSNAPTNRDQHTAVWTGTEMIIWGGQTYSFPTLTTFSDGARYNPATDTWTQIATNGAPRGRYSHTSVWTGSEMVVWGGSFWNGSAVAPLNDGARYNPTTDSWTPIATNNAPVGRSGHSAVWTGSEMIIWGGVGGVRLNDGARYNPTTDTWAVLPANGAPNASAKRTVVWAGVDIIVWGGLWYESYSSSGASYSPVSNNWSPVPATGGPSVRDGFSAVWTGSEMIVFGGYRAEYDSSGHETLIYLGDTYAYTPSRVMYLYLRQ